MNLLAQIGGDDFDTLFDLPLSEQLRGLYHFGTSISSYPLPTPAKNLIRSGFIRITTYSGVDGSL